MNLNRGLIKQQAKQLISGNVFKLFFIYLIIYLCMTALIFGGMGKLMKSVFKIMLDDGVFNSSNYENYDFDQNYDFYDFDYFDNFGKEDGGIADFDGSDFYNFQGDIPHGFGYDFDDDYDFDSAFNYDTEEMIDFFVDIGTVSILYTLGFIVMVLLVPLTVSLQGLFVSLIRGKRFTFGDGLNDVFRNTFKNNYGKKLGLVLLRGILIYLLSLLFVIPGIIYMYSSYFAGQIMCDSPEISPSKALETSKKMVKGNRTELFIMNLSFFPWLILCSITLGLGYIYVLPYFEATNALYYENFRIRALQEGRVTEDDFLSDAQIRAKYANIYANPNGAPNGNSYQQNGYQPYNQQNTNQYYNAQPQQAPQADYYNPVSNEAPVEEEPQTEYYNDVKTEEEPQAPVKDPQTDL